MRFLSLALVAIALLVAAPAGATRPESGPGRAGRAWRSFDARPQALPHPVAPSAGQEAAVAVLRARIPDLVVRYDPATGATRTLASATGYLTEGAASADPLELGLEFVRDNLSLLGLTDQDLADFEVTDRVVSAVTGATHIYLEQRSNGLPVYNGQLQIHVNRDGRLIGVNNEFMPDLAASLDSVTPALGPGAAVAHAARHLGLDTGRLPRALGSPRGVEQATTVEAPGISRRPIEASLMLLPIQRGEARLVWRFQVWTPDGDHAYDMTVDATSGDVWTRFDWAADAQYRVYAQPAQSPDHVTPLPPADGRTLVSGVEDSTASPYGWHDTDGVPGPELTSHRGNNVHAYDDANADNQPPAVEPDCGASLNCDFPLDLTLAPSASTSAAVTNLFYWTNVLHDIQYRHGFDEAAGNFQENSYGRGGAASDSLLAEAQDSLYKNNARIFVPPDGTPPRMEMFLWEPVDNKRVTVHLPASITGEYRASGAVFGPALTETGVTGDVAQPNDGVGLTSDACESLGGGSKLRDRVALLDRGSCSFGTQVFNVQEAGAVAAIIVNDQGDGLFTLPNGTDSDLVTIPTVLIGQTDGAVLVAEISNGLNATVRHGGAAVPDRDVSLANGVVVHEYGHGISIRQVGGPSNSSCLGNIQQPGEGWSDWITLFYTARAGDLATDPRGMGTYLLGQPLDGGGIRGLPYSTDPAVNDWTYETIGSGVAIPHGVGAVWAQVLWEAYWKLVDAHGFDPDLYNALGASGNQRMMLYVNEGFKNTVCSPSFLDARDAIIQAAVDNHGGEDVCRLWEAFAGFGLGEDATSLYGPDGLTVTNGFQVPVSCLCDPAPSADAGADRTLCLGDSTTLGTPALPNHSYSWAPDGETTAQIIVAPGQATTYTVSATIPSCGFPATDAVTVNVQNGFDHGLIEGFEGGSNGWSTTGLWHLTTDSICASPGYASPVNAMYYGKDDTCDYDTGQCILVKNGEPCGPNYGTLASPEITGLTASSTLSFDYFREVEYSPTGHGGWDWTWVGVAPRNSPFVYLVWSRNSFDVSENAWVNSGPISLGEWAGEPVQLVFVFDTIDDAQNFYTGWFIDNVVVTGESVCGNLPPDVQITAPAGGATVEDGTPFSFAGTAVDREDGLLTAGLGWTSDLDGPIGSGTGFDATLSLGTHTVTAAVTDSGSATGSDTVSVTVVPVQVELTSVAADDGWVLESSETSGVGGSLDAGGAGLRVGDDRRNSQYRAILSFDTSVIPDGATVLSATLRLRRDRLVGEDPFLTHGGAVVDVQAGGFGGDPALQVSDFEAPATVPASAALSAAAADGDLSEATLDAAGLAAIDKTGVTQLRVAFQLDDDNDGSNDYVSYGSSDNNDPAYHPVLVVTYRQ